MNHDALLIDAGTGNLHSVYNALLSLNYKIKITSNPDVLKPGERIILPGVGAFGKFMDGLREKQLMDAIKTAVKRGDRMLGICVGMQALFEIGDEGEALHSSGEGLGLLPGRVPHFPSMGELKIPHTGWNQLWHKRPSPLLKELPQGCYAYFNHSYYCAPEEETDIATTTDYGIDFCSIVHRDNLFGVQFHPEKSQRIGLKILQNFMES